MHRLSDLELLQGIETEEYHNRYQFTVLQIQTKVSRLSLIHRKIYALRLKQDAVNAWKLN